MGFLMRNEGLNVLEQMKLLKACHPGLNVRVGIFCKWEVARGPGHLVDSGMTGLFRENIKKDSSPAFYLVRLFPKPTR